MSGHFVLFDFDGVIANSFDTALKLANKYADKYGFVAITDQELEQLRHMPIKQIITERLSLSWYQLPFFYKELLAALAEHITDVPLIEGMREALEQLRIQEYKLGILSSNGQENIERFLKHNNLDMFEVIYADSSLFGKHHVIDRFLKKYNKQSHEIIYVGDEVRDVEAAQKSNTPIIAVSWGYNTAEILQAYKPDKIIAHPSELVAAIRAFNLSQ